MADAVSRRRWWRPRLSIRQSMGLVALTAAALAVLTPVVSRLAWLWRTPGSTNLVFSTGRNLTFQAPGKPRVNWPTKQTFEFGQPVDVSFDYEAELSPILPSGLPYRLTVSLELFDWGPGMPVLDRAEQSTWVVPGLPGWDRAAGRFQARLVPTRAGNLGVRHQVHATDLFGRRSLSFLQTGGLDAVPVPTAP